MPMLDDLLVVSIEQALAAPLCTARLAEAGARVIKIERDAGDFARGYDTAAQGDSSYFVWTNQGKESVCLNYKETDDFQLLNNIIAKADILVQNLAPGAMSRAGFDSKKLREKHPRLITCDISGYGENPAVADLKAYDFLVQSESGLVSVSGGQNELGRIGVSICDIGAGMTAHAGILEALIKRDKTGQGSGIKVSLFDVAAEWMTVPLIHAETGQGAPSRQGLRHPTIAPYGAYQSSDGAQTIISIQNNREWQRFCADVLSNPELTQHAKLATNNDRVKNRDYLDKCINTALRVLTSDQLRSKLAKASIAFGALNSVDDLSTHKALRRISVSTSCDSNVYIPAPPIVHSDSERSALRVVPKLGSSSKLIRAEFAHPEVKQ